MSRRFLTAQDVRLSGGGEILVDASTIVTPQALEAAQAAGIAIRTSAGAWTEPRPDRGPDAPLSPGPLAEFEEPDEGGGATMAVVTAVGRNRPGVLAEITAAIAHAQGNVHDVSQKILQGLFHMTLTCELPDQANFDAFKNELEGLGSADDFVVRVMNERVFRFMHRV